MSIEALQQVRESILARIQATWKPTIKRRWNAELERIEREIARLQAIEKDGKQ